MTTEVSPAVSPRAVGSTVRQVAVVMAACTATAIALLAGFQLGKFQAKPEILPIQAATAASGDSMAMATGPVSEDAEGVFFLDYNTGDLNCMVYYPRMGGFGAHFYANVLPALGGGGKNAKYLMVTGSANVTAASANTRPGGCLVYITDVTNGSYAAYAVPWNRSQESAGRAQQGQLLLVSNGVIRNYRLPGGNAAPAAIVDPNKK